MYLTSAPSKVRVAKSKLRREGESVGSTPKINILRGDWLSGRVNPANLCAASEVLWESKRRESAEMTETLP